MIDSKLFGDRLRAMRKKRGLPVEKISHQIDVTTSVFYKYEEGNALPTLETLSLICENLDCSSDFLMGHEVADIDPKKNRMIEIFNTLSKSSQDTALVILTGIRLYSIAQDTESIRKN